MNIIKPNFDKECFNETGKVLISSKSDNALTLEHGVIKFKEVEKVASTNTPGDGVYGTLGEGIQTLRLNTSVSRKLTGDIPSLEGVNSTQLMTEFAQASGGS